MVLYKVFFTVLILIIFVSCASSRSTYYRVRHKDTLDKISEKHDVSIEDILSVNDNLDPERIKPGKLIFIPGKKKSEPWGIWDYYKAYKKPEETEVEPPYKTHTVKHPGKLIWPLKRALISSSFGMRKLGRRKKQMHHGIDLVGKIGSPIKAAESGVVIYSGGGVKGYGNLVIIKHSKKISTVYAHNKKNLVKKGDFVKRGQTIALLGNSGRSTGAHLHFEVRVGKKAKNPIHYLPKIRIAKK